MEKRYEIVLRKVYEARVVVKSSKSPETLLRETEMLFHADVLQQDMKFKEVNRFAKDIYELD